MQNMWLIWTLIIDQSVNADGFSEDSPSDGTKKRCAASGGAIKAQGKKVCIFTLFKRYTLNSRISRNLWYDYQKTLILWSVKL